ncbi:hypothetical protein FUAX_13160 [Fulvitalea axinellae]|uniref:Uncharacterized protein n=1 Tax=Fulvitalea axinellae TaxID=1182444 RepID=A0AAU9D3B0_9BACT|nr:hypothetical protein FUAX_13160 [Fulvitalea axinellae]
MKNDKYDFRTKEFGLTDEGVHLLRNGFNYKTLPFGELESLRISEGKDSNNWVLVLAVGLGCVGGSLYGMYMLYNFLTSPWPGKINIEVIISVFILLMFGGYMVYFSLKSGPLILISHKGKRYKFPLRELVKAGTLDAFTSWLKEKQGVLA